MDLALNEHQQMLQQSVRSFMQRRASKGTIVALQKSETGIQPDSWSTIAELGWLGLLIPEEYGGGGRIAHRCRSTLRGVRTRAAFRPVLQLRHPRRDPPPATRNPPPP